jgi:hypothetical protein
MVNAAHECFFGGTDDYKEVSLFVKTIDGGFG